MMSMVCSQAATTKNKEVKRMKSKKQDIQTMTKEQVIDELIAIRGVYPSLKKEMMKQPKYWLQNHLSVFRNNPDMLEQNFEVSEEEWLSK